MDLGRMIRNFDDYINHQTWIIQIKLFIMSYRDDDSKKIEVDHARKLLLGLEQDVEEANSKGLVEEFDWGTMTLLTESMEDTQN